MAVIKTRKFPRGERKKMGGIDGKKKWVNVEINHGETQQIKKREPEKKGGKRKQRFSDPGVPSQEIQLVRDREEN